MNDFKKYEQLAGRYKALYPRGTRIELQMMGSDPCPIEPGTRGTVDVVDDLGTIHCTFDNGRQLGIIPGEDSFRKLTEDELLDEKSEKLIDQYLEKVNKEVIPCIEWVGMKNAYKYSNMDVPTDLLKMLHEKFVETYGSNFVGSDMGFVVVPGLAKVADGSIYPVLLTLDTVSSGEHWETTFFTPNGVLNSDSEDQNVRNTTQAFCPYQYWYTPEVEDDIHVDWDHCPTEVNAILKEVTELYPFQKQNEVQLE